MRESLFNRPHVQAVVRGRVLDLYAGAGLLGIEALSREAATVDFVERGRDACAVIRRNVALLEVADRARVLCAPVEGVWARLDPPYDLCFADPPYALDATPALLELLEGGLLTQAGLLLWRHPRRRPAPERLGPLARCDMRRYGDGVLETYRRGGSA